MTYQQPSSVPSSIFENGKLRQGIYKIRNLSSGTYLDIHQDSLEVCCRPAQNLEDGRGHWEIKSLGAGYTVRRVEPGKPDQFCTATEGVIGGPPLCVNAYPAAWRIETVDGIHRGYEYVRFYWGPTKKTWDLHCGQEDNGTRVNIHDSYDPHWQTWILIPVSVEDVSDPLPSSSGALGSGSPPTYDQSAIGQPSTRQAQRDNAELARDDFGTMVTEVTIVTTTKTYRIPRA